MKKRIFVWLLVVILGYLIAKILLSRVGINLQVSYYTVFFFSSFLPILFCLCLITIHITLGFFIWRDAKSRNDLLLDIPYWVWGLIGLTGGVLGLIIHWLANCSKLVKNQTVPTSYTPQPEHLQGLGDKTPPGL